MIRNVNVVWAVSGKCLDFNGWLNYSNHITFVGKIPIITLSDTLRSGYMLIVRGYWVKEGQSLQAFLRYFFPEYTQLNPSLTRKPNQRLKFNCMAMGEQNRFLTRYMTRAMHEHKGVAFGAGLLFWYG